MSDNNDHIQDLKLLLKLKRHEIPPPGYFNNFSGDVISRIQAGEAGGADSFFERLQSSAGIWGSAFNLFQTRPGVIAGLATSFCLLFLLGVALLDSSESSPAGQTIADSVSPSTSAAPEAAPSALMASAESLEAPLGGLEVSTNPVASLQPVSSLFGSPENPLFQNVGFVPARQ